MNIQFFCSLTLLICGALTLAQSDENSDDYSDESSDGGGEGNYDGGGDVGDGGQFDDQPENDGGGEKHPPEELPTDDVIRQTIYDMPQAKKPAPTERCMRLIAFYPKYDKNANPQPYIPTQKEINEVAADLPDPNPEIPEGMVMDRILVFGPEGFVKFIDMDPYVPDQPSDGPSGTAQCTVSGSSQ